MREDEGGEGSISGGRYVLDSFALLAYLGDEAGAGPVREILLACAEERASGWLSVINFGEVLYIVEREQGAKEAQKVVALIDRLPVEIVEADRRLTFDAAHIKANFALAYADAFAVALARQLQARVVTGDPEFRQVQDLVPVLWLGR